MKDIREKLKIVLSHYNVALSSIAVDGAMQTRLSRQVNMGASITYDTIFRFLEVFPNVSAEWLLRGKGEMIISESSNTIVSEDVSELKDKIQKQEEEITKLKVNLEYSEELCIKISSRLSKAEEALQKYEPKKIYPNS